MGLPTTPFCHKPFAGAINPAGSYLDPVCVHCFITKTEHLRLELETNGLA